MEEKVDFSEQLRFEEAGTDFYLAKNKDNSETWGIAKTVQRKNDNAQNQWIGFLISTEPDIRGTLHLTTFANSETAIRIMTAIHRNGGDYHTLANGDNDGLIDRVWAADLALSSFVYDHDMDQS
jgi:alpha-galactosidase/6-phospho-beta-glucosidase family protein